MVRTTSRKAQLMLRSRMADLALVMPWIESLATEYGISVDNQFAMDLCLEEILSNIIRHGYAGEPDRPIVVRFVANENKSCLLVVDDEAPHFNPLAAEDPSIEETLGGARIGGLGIHLVRNFAATLEYEATPAGNRLTIGFAAAE